MPPKSSTPVKPIILRFKPADTPKTYKQGARVILQYDKLGMNATHLYGGRVIAHDVDEVTLEVHIDRAFSFATGFGDTGNCPNWVMVETQEFPYAFRQAQIQAGELECIPDTKTVRALLCTLHEKTHYLNIHRIKDDHLRRALGANVI